ncbi:MAG: hypothetical protein ACREQI_12185 [Candidatus Binataceae bacterium]
MGFTFKWPDDQQKYTGPFSRTTCPPSPPPFPSAPKRPPSGEIPLAEAARRIAALIDDAIRHRATGAALAAATASDPE